MDKFIYITVSESQKHALGNKTCHSGWSAMGHEIHLSRFLLLDMYKGNFANKDHIIVTGNIERKILYKYSSLILTLNIIKDIFWNIL